MTNHLKWEIGNGRWAIEGEAPKKVSNHFEMGRALGARLTIGQLFNWSIEPGDGPSALKEDERNSEKSGRDQAGLEW